MNPIPQKTISHWKSIRSWKLVGLNFLKWMIPGLFVLAGIVFIIGFCLAAEDGQLLQINVKLPKGMLSFLGPSLLIIGSVLMTGVFIVNTLEVETYVYMIFLSIILSFLGYYFLSKELKRLGDNG